MLHSRYPINKHYGWFWNTGVNNANSFMNGTTNRPSNKPLIHSLTDTRHHAIILRFIAHITI